MECLYCGEKLGLLASKGRQFCNKKHQELWRQREAELSIQRLKDAFGFASSPSAKAKQTSTSVLDPGEEFAPESELSDEEKRRALPPATEFTYNDPRDPPVESPISRSRPEQPVENEGIFYCGPASERDTPPNAGFLELDEPKTTLRVPLYIRRPEPAKRSGKDEFHHEILAHQAIGQRDGHFAEDFSETLVDVCTVGQPGHSLPVASSELECRELGKSIQDQIRKLEFEAASAVSEALPFLPFSPAPELEPLRATAPASEQPVHEFSIPEVRPAALYRQEPKRPPVFPQISEIIAASFERPATAGPQPAASAAAPQAFGATHERAMPALPRSSFKTLTATESAAFHYTEAAPTAIAESTGSKLEARLYLRPREHAFQSPHFPGALGKEIFAAHGREPKTNVYGIAEQSYDPRPSSLGRREPRLQPVPQRAREIRWASLPPESVLAPQAVLSPKAPKARALALARPMSAPPANCTFQALTTGRKAATERSAPTVPVSIAWPENLGSPVGVHARELGNPDSKALGIQAYAPNLDRTETKTPRYLVRPPDCEILPKVLCQREIPAPPLVRLRPEIIPASVPAVALARRQTTAITKPPRTLPVAVSLRTPALPYSTFQAQTSGLGVPAEHTPPVTSARANLPNYKLGPKVQIPRRQFKFQRTGTAGPRLRMQPFTPRPENRPAQAQRASDPVYDLRPQASELRPLALAGRGQQNRSAFTPVTEIIAASVPPLAARHPNAAARRDESMPGIVIARNLPVLAHSNFEALTVGPCSSTQRNRPILPCPNLPRGDLGAIRVFSRKRAFEAQMASSAAPSTHIAGIESEQRAARVGKAAYQPVHELPQAFDVRPMDLGRRDAEREPVLVSYPKIILTAPSRPAARQPQPATRRSVAALPVTSRSATFESFQSTFETLAAAHCEALETIARAVTARPSQKRVELGVPARDPQFLVPASVFDAPSPVLPPRRGASKPTFFMARSGYTPTCPSRHLKSAGPYVPKALEPRFLAGQDRMEAPLFTATSSSSFVPLSAWTNRTEIAKEAALLSRLARRDSPATPTSSLLAKTEAKRQDQPAEARPASRGRRSIPAGAKPELTWVVDKIPWVPLP